MGHFFYKTLKGVFVCVRELDTARDGYGWLQSGLALQCHNSKVLKVSAVGVCKPAAGNLMKA